VGRDPKDNEATKEGVYGIVMTKHGEEKMVIIDDLIPSMDSATVFSKGNGPELWVILLEKAWAKLHGSYERQIGGIAYQTIRDITGAPGWSHQTAKMVSSADLLKKHTDEKIQ